MLKDLMQKRTLSIVLLGDFNPVIVQPYWLSNKGLIKELEAENVDVKLIHNELVQFEIGDWAYIEINKNRFEIKTSKEPYFCPIKDLVSSIFLILKETPINAFGINHIMDFTLTSTESYYNFGDKLSPLSNWNTFMKDPRIFSLEIIEENRQDLLSGSYRIRVSPSEIKQKNSITININDHILIEDKSAIRFTSELEKRWNDSFNRSNEIVEKLWNKITN